MRSMLHLSAAIVWAWILVVGCSPDGPTGALDTEDLYNSEGLDGRSIFDADGLAPPAYAEQTFIRAGLMWDVQEGTLLEGRTLLDGAWSPWEPIEPRWSEGIARTGHVNVPDGAQGLQLRIADGPEPSFLWAEGIARFGEESKDIAADVEEDGLDTIEQPLAPASIVHPRSSWGARSPNCVTYGHTPYKVTIHHTATPNADPLSPAARMRQMQNYHMDSRGMCDIGYHFVIDQSGQRWQGRVDETVLGAHTGGANSHNAGISFIGTYQSVSASGAQIANGAELIAWLSGAYGVPRDRGHVKGHREYGGTTCPGDALFAQIGSLLSNAPAAPPLLAAEFVGQGSEAQPDPDPGIQYRVCTGQPVHFWFELKNVGQTGWVDWGSNGSSWGHNVRLARHAETPDPLTGTRRISVNETANNNVHPPNWNAGDCNDRPLCQRVVFDAHGTAPSTPGVYRSDWQLVDEMRTWFGPEMWLKFNAVAPCQDRECGADPICGGSCGGCPAGLTCNETGHCERLADPTGCGKMVSGDRLTRGMSVESCDGRFELVLQGDGNLVLYRGETALWATGTCGQEGQILKMQPDGNLVLYTRSGTPIWNAGTVGHPGAWLAVQTDGNLVIYPGPSMSNAVWSSGTVQPPVPPGPTACGRIAAGQGLSADHRSVLSCDGRFELALQGDGNLVLYRGGAALWATGTWGQNGYRLEMQGDGNLVLYTRSGTPIWNAGTVGHPGAWLAVQTDGNLVIYPG
ncbi:MAG: N-acetylmuramoyl-L-alanine amidase, partial [Deltaproteobacteria bacterium]|nr:N-acetylmuramoyl-L-alanine amidase [Deltaproteobacteria bacterium]